MSFASPSGLVKAFIESSVTMKTPSQNLFFFPLKVDSMKVTKMLMFGIKIQPVINK